jgi:hypothetical protein
MHVLDVDGEGQPVAGLDRGLGRNTGHAFAVLNRRGLVLVDGGLRLPRALRAGILRARWSPRPEDALTGLSVLRGSSLAAQGR